MSDRQTDSSNRRVDSKPGGEGTGDIEEREPIFTSDQSATSADTQTQEQPDVVDKPSPQTTESPRPAQEPTNESGENIEPNGSENPPDRL